MIRLSQIDDRKGITALWSEAFGDSAEAIEFFLDRRYLPENTLVAEENGVIASMLFLLDGKVKIGKDYLDAYYLYAAATLKEFRGRGIMAQMLNQAALLANSRGVDLICLKPAEESLFTFYAHHGYKTVFKTKKATVKILETDSISADFQGNIDAFDAREKMFIDVNGFVWDKNAVDFAFEQHKYYGGKVLTGRNGYCLYSTVDGVCYVKEMCFTQAEIDCATSCLANVEAVNEIHIDLPVSADIAHCEYTVENNGMALLLSEKAEIINDFNDLYLNLTLD